MARADDGYDALVIKARSGDYAPALDFLAGQPATPRYLNDHIAIAGWAGRDAEVVQVYEANRGSKALSADSLAVVARAYRNLKRWPEALAAYRGGQALAPRLGALRVGEVMTLADAGQSEEALRRGQDLVRDLPQDPDARIALAYVHTRAGRRYAALFELDKARELAPDKAYVQREYLRGLEGAHLAEPALRIGTARPGLIDEAQARRLQADALAREVRFAQLPARREVDRFEVADRAIASSARLMQQWAEQPEAKLERNRVRVDRLGALHARVRMQQVVDEYEQLLKEQVAVPAYAERWVAGAYLYLRQPETSADLYRKVLASDSPKDPEWMDDNQGLFYALVECEQLSQLQPMADQLVAQQPVLLYSQGAPAGHPNENRLDAKILQANAYLFNDQLPQAQQAFEELSHAAPANGGLRTGLAGVYSARGWPRRAESELKSAEALGPRDLGVEVAQGNTALELQEWRQADLLADDVIQRFPEQLSAQRLDKLRKVQHMFELRVSAYDGHSTGGGEAVGDRDFGIDSVLYSPPIDENWRVFGGVGYATGDFVEGTGHYRYQRAGVEWRERGNTLEGELSHNDYGDGDKAGARLAGSHEIDDHWQYGWSADYLSRETPLRALNSGIRSNAVGAWLGWRQDETREWKLSATPQHFSDGNQRVGLVWTGKQQVYSQPYLKADLGLEVGASHNSKSDDVPYFNPKRDLSVLPTLDLDHILYRRYQTVWSQQAQFGVGTYTQQNHGTDPIALIGYGQRLKFDDRFDGGINLTAMSRPYDGDRELDFRLMLDINYRF
ncbi:poly-beta-1,6 N-acetyl-D-glucosamine export porin PgaA [Pseudomonas citronellolis]|uniref:poly-beta-1,6 N-acetyl-D-glucosamine export porin PgaA n=1 Tax=Pseudomonas citronellolis TaxID=53408 RepID=UPI0023E38FEC|nr:poly-beta-1,6 N-acetyl-D-glucosamine export porin PgaA [Pseudomonas citronellolis]